MQIVIFFKNLYNYCSCAKKHENKQKKSREQSSWWKTWKTKASLLLKMDRKQEQSEEENKWQITALIMQIVQSSLQKDIQVFAENKPRCLPCTDKHLSVCLYRQLYLHTKAFRDTTEQRLNRRRKIDCESAKSFFSRLANLCQIWGYFILKEESKKNEKCEFKGLWLRMTSLAF